MFTEDLSMFLKDFGQNVIFTLADNTTLPINAIFDENYINAFLGGTELQATKPVLTCISVEVTAVKRADKVLINNETYNVLKNPYAAPENPGFSLIELVK